MPPSQRSTSPHERTITQTRTMTFTLTFTLTLLCVTCTWHAALGQTNNTYDDATKVITFGEMAPDAPYATENFKADDGGLGPYYALARSFVDSSLPEELPIDTVKGIMDGDKSIADEWQQLATDFVGFALCVVIGFLFFFIFPIVALCFCCCRCCGNCGGKRIQKEQEKGSCKRNVFAVIVGILALFIVTGAACAFVSSDQITDNLDGLNTSFSNAVDDFMTFADNIDAQFTRLGDTNFRYMTVIVDDYVKGVSNEISERIINDVNALVGLDAPLTKLSELTQISLTKVGELEAKAVTLENQRSTAHTDLAAFNTACGNCINGRVNVMNAMSFTPLTNKIQSFKQKASTDVFGEMNKKISGEIKTEVEKGTSGLDVKAKMDDIFDNEIKDMLDQVDKFKDTIRDTSEDYQTQVGDLVEKFKPYDKYRWYAGLGLALFPLLIGVLLLTGVFLGFCCGSAKTPPTERGAGSNCGGICLMSAVGLIFIFSALLMLLTTVMYMFGSMTERYICQTIENLDRAEKYTESFDLGMDLSNMSFPVNGEEISTSISKVMSGCEEGKTLYTVLGLSGVVDTAMQQIRDYKKDLNVTDGIDMGQTANGLTGLNLSPEIQNLQKTATELTALETEIDTLTTSLNSEKTQAVAKDPSYGAPYDPMLATLADMKTITGELNSVAADTVTEANKLPALVAAASTKLTDASTMSGIIQNATDNFVNTIFGFVDSYIDDIQTKLSTSVAICTPLYSVTNAILTEAFCRGIIAPINGFWLALGWCIFFFMPSLIFGVKLAKYYRKMLYSDTYDSTIDAGDKPPYYEMQSAPPQKHSIFPPINGVHNKVSPY